MTEKHQAASLENDAVIWTPSRRADLNKELRIAKAKLEGMNEIMGQFLPVDPTDLPEVPFNSGEYIAHAVITAQEESL